MADATVQIVAVKDLTIITMSGSVTRDEVAAATRRYYGQGKPRNILWDFRGAEVSSIENQDIHHLLIVASGFTRFRVGGRTALVHDSDLGYGLNRMAQILAESSNHPVPLAVFRSPEPALDWLDSGRAPGSLTSVGAAGGEP